MSFTDVIKKSVLEGFQNSDMGTTKAIVILAVTLCLAVYLYFIYKLVNKSTMYDKEYHISMAMISVVTAGIIIAMQSNIVISLGMVGALSIVRFRTAVKSPLDLLFLFWSIGNGIICGAGLFETAVLVSLVVSAGVFLFEFLPGNKAVYLLIVSGKRGMEAEPVTKVLDSFAKSYRVKARNTKKDSTDLMFEVKTVKEQELLKALSELQDVEQFTLMTREGEVRF